MIRLYSRVSDLYYIDTSRKCIYSEIVILCDYSSVQLIIFVLGTQYSLISVSI